MSTTRWNYHVAEIKMQLFGRSMTERVQEELSDWGCKGGNWFRRCSPKPPTPFACS